MSDVLPTASRFGRRDFLTAGLWNAASARPEPRPQGRATGRAPGAGLRRFFPSAGYGCGRSLPVCRVRSSAPSSAAVRS